MAGANEVIGGAWKKRKKMADLINKLDMLMKILEDKKSMCDKIDGHGDHMTEHWIQDREHSTKYGSFIISVT
jgi:hypothetical protein